MKTYYDMKEWAARTDIGRRVFNAGFRMLAGDLPDWELVKAIPFEASHGQGEFVYMWQRGGGIELLRVGVAELADWRSAHQRLRDDLRMSMRSDIPRASGKLGHLGDVAYVSRSAGADVAASISFARGNVCASVRSVGDREADGSEAALWLDEVLGQAPGPGAERGARRIIERRRENVQPRGPGHESVVVRSVAEVTREAWLQALADEGSLFLRKDTLVHVATERHAARVDLYTYKARRNGERSSDRPRGSM